MNIGNIVLIGMPNAGKSSSGRAISRKANMEFMDTDILITKKIGKKPPEIVNEDGLAVFLKIQEETILSLYLESSVISTGGAVVFNELAMAHLRSNGKVFFLDQDVEVLKERISKERRFASTQGKSFEDIYNERMPLYIQFSDHVINCRGKEVEDIADEVISKFHL